MNMDASIAKGAPDTLEQAEHWFIRVSDPDCPGEVRAACARWRATSAEHEAAYLRVEDSWSLGGEALAGDPSMQLALRRAARPTPRRRRRWLLPAAAAAAVLLVSLLLVPYTLHQRPADGVEYTTAIGQQRTVTLPDGSSMVLDTDSDVRVRYGNARRRIDLLRGRAQFRVQGNPDWPFVVHAQGGTVTAVGTWFQVRLDREKTDVTLLEGKLAIATRHRGVERHAALLARQRLAFDRSGTISPVGVADLQAAEGWTAGKLFVDDWRLADLLQEMNRYSTHTVEVADPSVGNLRISGVFRTDDQQTLLLILEQGWSLQASRTAAGRVVLSRR